MKILITGARGMVARATAEYCRSIGDDVAALTRDEMNIADLESVHAAIEGFRPDAIINCAAYTNVDGAESEPEDAFSANVVGPWNLAQAALEFDCGFVTISTDYVFDGTFDGFYTQRHQPNPQGIYATTKRSGEIDGLTANARSIVVRSGWIYGHGGTNFLSVMGDLLRDCKRIKAIKDSYGTPTFAGDLARRLRELAELDMPGIFHVTNAGEGTSYLGFAEKVCEIGGFDSSLLDPVSNADLHRPAPRPTSSKLACLFSEKFGLVPMPEWGDGLRRFVNGDLD
ncbi:MAG: dTDP-4-dehydrorhamnose reductase [bacterium]|nr:dTDP-4-dehydrorhamnose reductase [bacterium]